MLTLQNVEGRTSLVYYIYILFFLLYFIFTSTAEPISFYHVLIQNAGCDTVVSERITYDFTNGTFNSVNRTISIIGVKKIDKVSILGLTEEADVLSLDSFQDPLDVDIWQIVWGFKSTSSPASFRLNYTLKGSLRSFIDVNAFSYPLIESAFRGKEDIIRDFSTLMTIPFKLDNDNLIVSPNATSSTIDGGTLLTFDSRIVIEPSEDFYINVVFDKKVDNCPVAPDRENGGNDDDDNSLEENAAEILYTYVIAVGITITTVICYCICLCICLIVIIVVVSIVGARGIYELVRDKDYDY